MEAEERQGAGGISVDPAQRGADPGVTDPTIWCSRAPGGSNGIPRGAAHPPHLRRVYQAAVAAAGKDLLHLDLQAPRPMQARVVAVIADRWRWRWPSCPRCAPRRFRGGGVLRPDAHAVELDSWWWS